MPRNHAPAPEDDDWLTPQETASLTKYSPQTLANHRYRGVGIPYVKLPSGRIRYRLTDVQQYLTGQLVA